MTTKEHYETRKKLRKCTACGSPLVDPGCKCVECRRHESEVKKRWYAKKKTSGECLKCKQPATVKMYCAEHWFVIIVRAGFKNIELVEPLKALLEKQNHQCALTGRKLQIGINASIDHIIPRSKGGKDTIDNLQWVDLDVNFSKSDLSQDEFINLAKEIVEHASRNITNN
jgi:5-methylcytosine-specific restriction endonuclease McrA